MSVDESISGVNSSFGLPIAGRGPKSIIQRITAKLIWPFLRHQVDVNHVLVAEMRDLQAKQEVLLAVVEQQLSSTGHTTMSIRQLGDQLDFVEDGLHNVENALHILEGQYTYVVEQRENHLSDVQTHLTARTQQLENQIDLGHRQLLARFYDGFGALQRDVTTIAHNFHALESQIVEFEQRATGDIQSELGAFSREAHAERQKIASLLARMAEVDFFLTEVKRSYPDLVAPERLVALPSGFDALSMAFVETFRGTYEEIKDRLSVYLPELKSVAELGPVLDVGCGRGELLDMLRDADIEAYGIELGAESVELCRARGLDARVDDALHHLGNVPEHSLGAVTAIHVVEHLDIDTLVTFVDLCLRALKPGGLIIFETPNPSNVIVGSDRFWVDPTHVHPLPSDFLRFVVSMRGFTDAEVVAQKRGPEFATKQLRDVAGAELVEQLGQMLFGPEDYAIVARRAS